MAIETALSPKGGSDRNFGLVFAAFFLAVALVPLWHGKPLRGWSLVLCGVFALTAALRPHLLRPLNFLWTKLGEVLHIVMSNVALCIVFYGAILPTGLIMRVLKKDPLRLRFDPNTSSYWITRNPPGPEPESLKRQF